MQVVAPDTWIRRGSRVVVFAGIVLLGSIAFAAMVLVIVIAAARAHFAALDAALSAALLLAPAIVLAVMGRRTARAGLRMSAEGIEVRGPWSTWRLPLSEARSFVPGVQAGAGNGTPCPLLQRAQGPPIGVWALGHEGLVWRMPRYMRELEPLCGQLNDVLESLRADAR